MNLGITLFKLINGNSEILEHYQHAWSLWDKIWRDDKSMSVEGLSTLIGEYQTEFEQKCGGELSGKEIMPWSGFAYLLESNGDLVDKEKAKRLKKAFEKSQTSLEIKHGGREPALHFNVVDE